MNLEIFNEETFVFSAPVRIMHNAVILKLNRNLSRDAKTPMWLGHAGLVYFTPHSPLNETILFWSHTMSR